MEKNFLMKKFLVHDTLLNYVDYFVTDTDWNIINASDENGIVSTNEFSMAVLENEYKRGVINKKRKNGKIVYEIGTFHKRIDCCLRGEREYFDELPMDVRRAIVEYEQDINLWVVPYRKQGVNACVVTPLPIEYVLDIVDNSDCKFWVQECDCKAYRNDKEHITETCIHFMHEEDVLNSNYDRGYGRQISREETKKLLIELDKDGLVHNYEKKSICNCCSCCCWALRGIDDYRKKGYDIFEEYIDAKYIIKHDTQFCTSCGNCCSICPMQALEITNGNFVLHSDKCIGCGLCRAKCTGGALKIVER